MPNTNRAHSWFLMAGVSLFLVLGLIIGSPNTITIDTFGDLIRAFFMDKQVWLILAGIFVDVGTGVACAWKLGILDIQRLATFYRTMIIPYLMGYMIYWAGVYFGLPIDDTLQVMLGSGGAALILATLAGSIADNIKRIRLGANPPDMLAMRDVPIQDVEG